VIARKHWWIWVWDEQLAHDRSMVVSVMRWATRRNYFGGLSLMGEHKRNKGQRPVDSGGMYPITPGQGT